MILYPPAKINLGLNILRKREDGYHDIDTCMVEIPFTDILEVTKSESFEFVQTGITINGIGGTNLCEKAYHLMRKDFEIGPVRIHLRKQIPVGAGLGGGSADATYTLLAMNQLFQLQLSNQKLKELSADLGSDCPFFVQNKAALISGRGEVVTPVQFSLSGKYLVVMNPGIHISTAQAFQGIQPKPSNFDWNRLVQNQELNDALKNDFEPQVFKLFPEIEKIKENLLKAGSIYASMSGTGSTVYGIFNEKPEIDWGENYFSRTFSI